MARIVLMAVFLAHAAVAWAQTVLVKPYVQPGDGSVLGEKDVKVICWMTDQKPAVFRVEYGATKAYGRVAAPERRSLNLTSNQLYFTYSAVLRGLPLATEIFYRVAKGPEVVREGSFLTRKPPGAPINFVVMGDTAEGKKDERKIAWQVSLQKPEFIVIVGDIVYSKGKVREYMDHFWREYNDVETAGPTTGAPLMQSIPIYAVLGNHDVNLGANLLQEPDSLAAFYFFHPPLNGPRNITCFTPIKGPPFMAQRFLAGAAPSYPALCFYSFDDGPCHFLVLDANPYVNIYDPRLAEWIRGDLVRTKARWKCVFFHQPGFESSPTHYEEQRMRAFTPLFEATGVDVVFSGHIHNYQRSKPFKFTPNLAKLPRERIDGEFAIDESFDGVGNTRPNGIIYIVTGGGGAPLVTHKSDPKHGPPVAFTAKAVSDRHSFTRVQANATEFLIRQIDENGGEIDVCRLTK